MEQTNPTTGIAKSNNSQKAPPTDSGLRSASETTSFFVVGSGLNEDTGEGTLSGVSGAGIGAITGTTGEAGAGAGAG